MYVLSFKLLGIFFQRLLGSAGQEHFIWGWQGSLQSLVKRRKKRMSADGTSDLSSEGFQKRSYLHRVNTPDVLFVLTL